MKAVELPLKEQEMKAAEVSQVYRLFNRGLGNCVITWSKRRGCCKSIWWSLVSDNLTHCGGKKKNSQ